MQIKFNQAKTKRVKHIFRSPVVVQVYKLYTRARYNARLFVPRRSISIFDRSRRLSRRKRRSRSSWRDFRERKPTTLHSLVRRHLPVSIKFSSLSSLSSLQVDHAARLLDIEDSNSFEDTDLAMSAYEPKPATPDRVRSAIKGGHRAFRLLPNLSCPGRDSSKIAHNSFPPRLRRETPLLPVNWSEQPNSARHSNFWLPETPRKRPWRGVICLDRCKLHNVKSMKSEYTFLLIQARNIEAQSSGFFANHGYQLLHPNIALGHPWKCDQHEGRELFQSCKQWSFTNTFDRSQGNYR